MKNQLFVWVTSQGKMTASDVATRFQCCFPGLLTKGFRIDIISHLPSKISDGLGMMMCLNSPDSHTQEFINNPAEKIVLQLVVKASVPQDDFWVEKLESDEAKRLSDILVSPNDSGLNTAKLAKVKRISKMRAMLVSSDGVITNVTAPFPKVKKKKSKDKRKPEHVDRLQIDFYFDFEAGELTAYDADRNISKHRINPNLTLEEQSNHVQVLCGTETANGAPLDHKKLFARLLHIYTDQAQLDL